MFAALLLWTQFMLTEVCTLYSYKVFVSTNMAIYLISEGVGYEHYHEATMNMKLGIIIPGILCYLMVIFLNKSDM